MSLLFRRSIFLLFCVVFTASDASSQDLESCGQKACSQYGLATLGSTENGVCTRCPDPSCNSESQSYTKFTVTCSDQNGQAVGSAICCCCNCNPIVTPTPTVTPTPQITITPKSTKSVVLGK